MARTTLIVYAGRDNEEDLVLLADGTPVDPTPITRVKLTVGATVLDSDASPALFDWPVDVTYEGAAAKALRLLLGGAGLSAGNHADCRLEVWDPSHPNGLVWTDGLNVKVKA